MAARRKVGKHKSRRRGRGKGSIRRPGKPPLHVLSDFGTQGNSPLAKRVGNDRKMASKGDYGKK
jgi:hypothetical protein